MTLDGLARPRRRESSAPACLPWSKRFPRHPGGCTRSSKTASASSRASRSPVEPDGRAAAEQPAAGAFAGVPFLLKNIGSMWQGTHLTAGLRYLENLVCGQDSEMVSRIKQAGFLLLGRTNTPEGGWCIGTEPRLYGPTLNPWNPDVTPGGSSGGAAAAVAAQDPRPGRRYGRPRSARDALIRSARGRENAAPPPAGAGAGSGAPCSHAALPLIPAMRIEPRPGQDFAVAGPLAPFLSLRRAGPRHAGGRAQHSGRGSQWRNASWT